jgi:glycoside/pentoside/hexuronide:cation symporter, GPH family
MEMSAPRMMLRDKIGYGLGDLATGLYFNVTVVFLLIFYTDYAEIPPATAGAILLLARVIDAFFDPLMGAVAHRTVTRWGKFRPYILFGAPALGLSFVAMFVLPDSSVEVRTLYAFLTFTLFGLIYSVVNIPYLCLNAAMTPHSDERTDLATSRLIFGFAASLIIYGFYAPLIAALGGGANNYLVAAIILTVGATLLYWLCFAMTRE